MARADVIRSGRYSFLSEYKSEYKSRSNEISIANETKFEESLMLAQTRACGMQSLKQCLRAG